MITLTTTSNKYLLKFYHKQVTLTFCNLLALRNTINAINIESHFYEGHSGVELISICNLKEILLLDTLDVLELKKIMDSIFSPKKELVY